MKTMLKHTNLILVAAVVLAASLPNFASAQSSDQKHIDAVFKAARDGDLDSLKQLIGNGSADIKMADGATPLFDAAMKGQIIVLKWLLEKGAKANSALPNGTTALHLAVAQKQIEACKTLIESGADINATITNGKTRLTPLQLAIDRKAADIALLLIERKADVNAPLGRGYVPDSPLEQAAWPEPDSWTGQKDVIKALVAKGAKSPWLSQIKEFDPFNVNALTPEKNGKGEIVAGSWPLILGAHSATRPWKLPPENTRSKTGKNFWRWGHPETESGPLTTTMITDEKRNKTELQLVPAIYIGDSGIAYSENTSTVEKGGPFVEIIVDASEDITKVTAVRGNGKMIELTKGGTSFRTTLDSVTDYEPVSITKYTKGNVPQLTVEFDCPYRAAKRGAVIYHVR